MNVYFSENRKRRSSQESKLSEEVMGKSKIGPYAVFVHEQVTTYTGGGCMDKETTLTFPKMA